MSTFSNHPSPPGRQTAADTRTVWPRGGITPGCGRVGHPSTSPSLIPRRTPSKARGRRVVFHTLQRHRLSLFLAVDAKSPNHQTVASRAGHADSDCSATYQGAWARGARRSSSAIHVPLHHGPEPGDGLRDPKSQNRKTRTRAPFFDKLPLKVEARPIYWDDPARLFALRGRPRPGRPHFLRPTTALGIAPYTPIGYIDEEHINWLLVTFAYHESTYHILCDAHQRAPAQDGHRREPCSNSWILARRRATPRRRQELHILDRHPLVVGRGNCARALANLHVARRR